MKNVLVSTENVQRILSATKALELRMGDPEIAGLGLITGDPGLGKTLAAKHYTAQAARRNRFPAVYIRALAVWTPASMLKSFLRELGREPDSYRTDLMFDTIIEHLERKPTFFLVDEADSFAGITQLVRIIKDIHDMTSCVFLLIGESRVQRILARYTSFFNRINTSAIVELGAFSAGDIEAVIHGRSEITITQPVCDAISTTFSGSMRSIIDTIRGLELWGRANDRKEIALSDYKQALGIGRSKPLRVAHGA